MEIKGIVNKIIHHNPETRWTVMSITHKDCNGVKNQTQVVGNYLEISEGDELSITGEMKDKGFGPQLHTQAWKKETPTTAAGIEKYLESGFIDGIGQKNATAIVSMFGENTIDILDNHPDELLKIPGIGAKRLAQIKDSWTTNNGIRLVMTFLYDLGVSTSCANKIYRQYGKNSIAVVKADPYVLADEVDGIGFETADKIALSMGYAREDSRRCRAGILHVFKQLAREGQVCSDHVTIIKKSLDLLKTDFYPVANELSLMLINRNIIVDLGLAYLPNLYIAEYESADRLRALIYSPGFISTRGSFNNLTYTGNINYTPEQLSAIQTALNSKVMVLTGGPGTGKTTTTQGIINAFASAGMNVLLAAPTGCAADRMFKATNMPASTIHRLLEVDFPNGKCCFNRNANNPLNGDVLIVDESSMIDIQLFHSLMMAIPNNMHLVLVGDVNQLPSIGPGNVLRDIIDSQRIPVVELNTIFRQGAGSSIIRNASRINNGIMPDISNAPGSDFIYIEENNDKAIASEIIDLVTNQLPDRYGIDSKKIQILTPMRKGELGTIELNKELQMAINPIGPSLCHGGTTYRIGDKVMQIRNDYVKNVFNGEIGYITDVDIDEKHLTIQFDNKVNTIDYHITELDDVCLAYAMTVHKSQGNEFPIVVIPVTMQHKNMIKRNLLYTGVTRAKQSCVLIGNRKALAAAVNTPGDFRDSNLKERLM